MLATRRIAPADLADLCRVLRHSLAAGLPVATVFSQQAASGPSPVRSVAAQIGQDLHRGDSLAIAMARHEPAFPPLFVALATLGEQTGTLATVFGELERHYQLQHNLRRQFLTQSARPALQLLVAVLIIAGLIWVLGAIAEAQGMPPLDPLGLGLTGARGAVLFLTSATGLLLMLAGLAVLVRRLALEPGAAATLLRVPLVGPCLRALALARLCLALRLTLGTSMPLDQALTLSLRATGNAAFVAALPPVLNALQRGESLTVCLNQTDLLPGELRHMLEVAEASGQVPEVTGRQAESYQEEADRRLVQLTRIAAFLVWLLMAALVTWAIVRIFINVYLSPWDALS